MAANPVWHRALYSCTHVATVDVKGLSLNPCICLHTVCRLCSRNVSTVAGFTTSNIISLKITVVSTRISHR